MALYIHIKAQQPRYTVDKTDKMSPKKKADILLKHF